VRPRLEEFAAEMFAPAGPTRGTRAGALHSPERLCPAGIRVDHAAVIASMAAPGVQL
jgi:hypothetical protein